MGYPKGGVNARPGLPPLHLLLALTVLPAELSDWALTLKSEGFELEYVFDSNLEKTGVPSLLRKLSDLGIAFKDLNTRQSSLEDIFVSLVRAPQ